MAFTHINSTPIIPITQNIRSFRHLYLMQKIHHRPMIWLNVIPAVIKRAQFTSQFYITLQIALIMSTLYKEITGGLNTLHKVYWTITLPPLLTAVSGEVLKQQLLANSNPNCGQHGFREVFTLIPNLTLWRLKLWFNHNVYHDNKL